MEPAEQLTEWMNDYMDRLVRIAHTYVRDAASAEDCVQNAFIKAYHSVHQLRDMSSAFPWLVRIVINECRMAKRRSWREVLGLPVPQVSSSSAEEELLRHARDDEVHQSILALPEKYRTPIVLYYFESLSNKEIAEVLRVNPATVRTRIVRGRQLLKTALEEGEVDGDGFQSQATRC